MISHLAGKTVPLVISFLLLSFLLSRCRDTTDTPPPKTLFTQLPGSTTGINFINQLTYSSDFNIYTYRNFYNGGGVGLGDINNDGLIDVYFTSNQGENKLYLNKGSFRFEDITDRAGVAGRQAWSTGVSMADVNGDGLLDIYVSNSGDVQGDKRQNELFINNGDLTFSERAEEWGAADRGYTTHAVFFDYDKDGDLDLYILNNSFQAIGSFNLKKNERGKRDPLGGHKLLRNDNGHFTDVSEKAGIFGSVISFGLGVAVGDVDRDGWQDIYVSNDFFERDYLYINNRNGTFRECLTEQMESVSAASMGADMADINNDGYPDIFVTEMLPEKNDRLKTLSGSDTWDHHQEIVADGYFHQFSRNMLQLNNGNGTFSEIGRLAHVEASDWSWGALIFDMNNDGRKDIFVANGIYHDLTNQDFLQFVASQEIAKAATSGKRIDYKKLIDALPSTKTPNYAFINEGGFRFVNHSADFGLSEPGFSNGSAYGDLDNDGDMDLVVNNVNMPAFVYRNEADTMLRENHYLKFKLEGSGKNTFALGAQVSIDHQGKKFYLEQMPIRGFESSNDPRPNFGLGTLKAVDSVSIMWPDGKISRLTNVKTNQTITVKQADARTEKIIPVRKKPALWQEEDVLVHGIDFVHHENNYIDFNEDRLIYHMLSSEGPGLTVADVNGDGRDDFFIGGATGQRGALYVQTADGKFLSTNQDLFDKDKVLENTGALFFDADKDGDVDLYVVSGGREFPVHTPGWSDRLYFNDAHGNFTRSPQQLPVGNMESDAVVKSIDYDMDGDLDLFVGSRMQPRWYGYPVNGYILNNDGKGSFKDVTASIAPGLIKAGMITDACWADMDGDGDPDLVVTGEYMQVKIFLNGKGKFTDATAAAGLSASNGWWNRIRAADLDGDGDLDLVAGNHGLNSRFRASREKPVTMYINDFDQNGTVEQIICTWQGDKQYPLVLRHDLVAQIASLRKQFLKYESYKDVTINEIFSEEQMRGAIKLDAYELATCVFINQGNGKFEMKPLPEEAQFAPVYGILILDMDHDGINDILLGGNFYRAKPEVGRYDASHGLVLKGDGKGNFVALTSQASGINFKGEIRDLTTIRIHGVEYIVVVRNDSRIQLYKKEQF